eukprot:5336092-Pleurochrysis_carterae.AAC.1
MRELLRVGAGQLPGAVVYRQKQTSKQTNKQRSEPVTDAGKPVGIPTVCAYLKASRQKKVPACDTVLACSLFATTCASLGIEGREGVCWQNALTAAWFLSACERGWFGRP